MGRENGVWMKVEENCIARQQVCDKIQPSINLTISTNFTFVTPDETHHHGGFLGSDQYSLLYRIKGRKPSVDVARVKALRDSGMGASAIANELGIGRASVYRALGS
jgi:hypothetical protein